MRPKQQAKARHDDLFRTRLDQIINMKHELVVLADRVDWAWLDDELAGYFSDEGRPAEPVRFMLGMLLLKHTSGCQRRSKISPPGRSKTSPLNVMRYAVLGGCPGSP